MKLYERYKKAGETPWTKDGELEKRIEGTGLTPTTTNITVESSIKEPLERCKDLNTKIAAVITQKIEEHGSAIFSLGSHGHVVVIDSISTDTGARIREPWSGIDITVNMNGFSNEMGYSPGQSDFTGTQKVSLQLRQIQEYKQHTEGTDQKYRRIKEKLLSISREVDQISVLEKYCATENITITDYLSWISNP